MSEASTRASGSSPDTGCCGLRCCTGAAVTFFTAPVILCATYLVREDMDWSPGVLEQIPRTGQADLGDHVAQAGGIA